MRQYWGGGGAAQTCQNCQKAENQRRPHKYNCRYIWGPILAINTMEINRFRFTLLIAFNVIFFPQWEMEA